MTFAISVSGFIQAITTFENLITRSLLMAILPSQFLLYFLENKCVFFFWFLVMKFVYLTSDLEITKREIIMEKSLRQSLSSL